MAYSKTNWENLPSINTPINASRLNKIENELEFLDGNSSWVSLGNKVYYKKVGNVVTVRGFSSGTVKLTANEYTTVATLPAEIRPSMELAFPWVIVGEGTAGLTKIRNGNIMLFANTTTIYWAFTVTYVL